MCVRVCVSVWPLGCAELSPHQTKERKKEKQCSTHISERRTEIKRKKKPTQNKSNEQTNKTPKQTNKQKGRRRKESQGLKLNLWHN